MTATLAGRRIDAHITGETSGQIAIGDFNVQNNLDNGSVLITLAPGERPTTSRRPSPRLTGTRPVGVLGRDDVTDEALASLVQARALEFVGAPGAGKTTLVKHLAHQAPSAASADGVVYLEIDGVPVDDTLQRLWDSFYKSDFPLKPTPAQLELDLQPIHALVVLDNFVTDRGAVDRVRDCLPEATFVFATARRALMGAGLSMKLRGLDEESAVALFERELGRTLAGDDRAVAAVIAEKLDGQPLALLQAAALVSELGYELRKVSRAIEKGSPPDALARMLLDALDEDQRKVVELLATLDGATLPARQLAELTGVADAAAVVESLLALSLIQAHSPRYSATTAAAAATSPGTEARWNPVARAHFIGWAERHRRQTSVVLEEEQAVLAVLRAAAQDRAWADVVRLGRAIEGPLMLGRRWGAWREVLDLELTAARQVSDRAAEAWALHQRGTRSVGLGDREVGRFDLTRALEIREDLGDVDGAAVTRHNLGMLGGVKPPGRRWDAGQMGGLPLLFLLGVLVILGGGGVIWRFWPDPDTDTKRPPTPIASVLRFEPATLEFGDQAINTLGTPQRVTVTNDGGEDVTIADVSLGGGLPDAYRADAGCVGVVLDGGAHCEVAVVFGPHQAGRHLATLAISRSGAGTAVVPLIGMGTGEGLLPDLRLIPDTVDFGTVAVGQRSAPRIVTVKNVGRSDLDLGDVALQAERTQFAMSLPLACPDTLPMGGQCDVRITFGPTVAGGHLGAVSVAAAPSGPSASTVLRGVGDAGTEGDDCSLIVPTDPQTVVYGSRVALQVSGRAETRTALRASGLGTGLSFRDMGDGTGEISGIASSAPGESLITVTCDAGDFSVSRSFTLQVVPAELTVRWAKPLLDVRAGPAIATAIVTKPEGSAVELGSLKLVYEFTNLLTQEKTRVDDVAVDGIGLASLDLTTGVLPIGAYTVRALLADVNPYFVLRPPTPPTAVVVNTDMLSATAYTLSDLVNQITS